MPEFSCHQLELISQDFTKKTGFITKTGVYLVFNHPSPYLLLENNIFPYM